MHAIPMGFLGRKDCVCYKYLKLKALSAGGGLLHVCMLSLYNPCVCYKYLKRLLLLLIPLENEMHRPHTLVA